MVHRIRKGSWRTRRRGSEVLEVALLLPIVLGLSVLACTYGYYFYVQHNVQGAAREGARACVPFGATEAGAQTKIAQYLSNCGLDPADFGTISFNPNPDTANPGDDITVTIEGTWGNVGFNILPAWAEKGWVPIPSSKVIRGRAVMRKEG